MMVDVDGLDSHADCAKRDTLDRMRHAGVPIPEAADMGDGPARLYGRAADTVRRGSVASRRLMPSAMASESPLARFIDQLTGTDSQVEVMVA